MLFRKPVVNNNEEDIRHLEIKVKQLQERLIQAVRLQDAVAFLNKHGPEKPYEICPISANIITTYYTSSLKSDGLFYFPTASRGSMDINEAEQLIQTIKSQLYDESKSINKKGKKCQR